ncbi:patatin-like phospholipase [Palleronia aestuarii]|uniref:Patatin-like phospholipase n=1 Tax=Palleronia aestuarii TaxID=568105 RepID=A0A2W7NAE5_9RHOB|nr:patatin-like phospholipase family protein [Palleronia aestuarii]PZX16613.1 patatin-like phospholipase [Palleronia aestuarii]
MAQSFYDQIVFSGGGTRCMWQGGFIDYLRTEIPIEPKRIIGVSGGACTGCGFITKRGTRVRDTFIDRFAAHDRNIPLHEPFDGEPGRSPHQLLYRDIIEECFGDEEARKQIAEGPQFQILIARPPDDDWKRLTGAAMTLVYVADTQIRSNPHLEWAEKMGLREERVDANQAARDGTLLDLVCAAATIPPAFDPPDWDGRPAIDAGMADQAPMPVPDEGTSLILLTKRFRNLPKIEGRTYVQPSQEVPADKIDFTDPEQVRDTWRIGEEDARNFLAELREAKSE